MHSWARWSILIFVLALTASVSAPARASFGECSSVDYLKSFDVRLGPIDYDCVERLRVPVSTTGGERSIRILHDRDADWIADAAAMASFERGVRGAADAIGRLGGVALEDVTVLLADDFPPREGADRFSDIAALTDFENDGECRIIVYLVGPASLSEYGASVAAHEIFHCVEVANLSAEQMTTGSVGAGGGGDWWIEGAATWFAALAVPDATLIQQNVDAFDAASATTPLNRMAYEAAVFFLWLGEDASPEGVMRFLHAMAGSRDESAQRAAMMAALPQEGWLRFAEAYLDRDIHHPHGTDLGLSPDEGEEWGWTATRTQSQPLEPFVLVRSKLVFACGHWRTSVNPAPAHHAENSGAWAPLPEEIDASSGSEGHFRFVAMHAAASRVTLRLVGTMESGCGDCAGVRTTDACVVGSWQLTGGGPVEWMRAQGVPITSASMANETVTFRADGTFVTGAAEGHLETQHRDMHGEGDMHAQAGGRWSTSGGVLNLCTDMQAFGGRATVTRRGESRTVPLPSMPPANTSERYTCGSSTMDTERDIPRSPPMPFHYTRTSGG